MDPGQENINPINSAGECLLPSPVSSPRQPKRAEASGDDGLGVVRIKPLGVGGGGVERTAAEADGKGAVSFDLGANEVEVRGRRFEYPSHVIGPDSSQEELYQGYMPPRIAGFLAGYNCNIMAYGQTGTGKTHTMVRHTHSCMPQYSRADPSFTPLPLVRPTGRDGPRRER